MEGPRVHVTRPLPDGARRAAGAPPLKSGTATHRGRPDVGTLGVRTTHTFYAYGSTGTAVLRGGCARDV